MNDREIKRRIRVLRKLKKDTRVKSEGRRELNRKIRELKKELNKGIDINPEKTIIIEKIYKIRPYLKTLRDFNLYKHTIKELQFHLDRITGKIGRKR